MKYDEQSLISDPDSYILNLNFPPDLNLETKGMHTELRELAVLNAEWYSNDGYK